MRNLCITDAARTPQDLIRTPQESGNMSGETNEDKKSTEMLTAASAFILCFVLFFGIKLRWFRARMRFDTNNIRTGTSSVAAVSAPTFSVTGVYRPIGSTFESQVNTVNTKTDQKPQHHKSMPNLTESSGTADVTIKTPSIPQPKLLSSSNTEMLSHAEAHNSVAANFSTMKLKPNGDMYSSTPDITLTANHSETESKQKKKAAQKIATTKMNILEMEEPDNFIFLNSNGKPISFVENNSTEISSHKTKTKTKSKAPAPPPQLTNSKFHEYEEFDT